MKICFLDSAPSPSAFADELLAIVRGVGEVERIAVGAASAVIVRELAAGGYDRYVFCGGTEALASRLLPFDLPPSFLVPALDTATTRPDAFWRQFVKHRMLCFSRGLHERLQRLSCATHHFQYFTEPRDGDATGLSDRTAAVFREGPGGGIVTLPLVLGLARALGVRRVDIESAHRPPCVHVVDGVQVTVSGTRSGAAAEHPALFHFTGAQQRDAAGLAAAMAAGRIVVAPEQSLAADYCAHGVSGLLYDPDPGSRVHLPQLGDDAVAAMSRAARRRAMNGRTDWLGDIARLQGIIADDGRRWSTLDCSAPFARAIRSAAHQRAWHG